VSVALVTGSGGLVGGACVRRFAKTFDTVVGADNDMRAQFFGDESSSRWMVEELGAIPNYVHHDIDIRDREAVAALFAAYDTDIELIVHAAAQPSHDWAARQPFTDFDINAVGTLNLLEATRQHSAAATFVFCSTNKVYGDRPNDLPLLETDTRWTLDPDHPWADHGIPEDMSIDQSTHSLFGASKAAADLLVQEYGRYFEMNTGVFRGGCLTGPGHSGAELHGFLAYLMKATATGLPYTIFGYSGKQVRDNIHSSDLVDAFEHFHADPKTGGAVYNIGGGVEANVSMLEAIALCEEISGKRLNHTYDDVARKGDHQWYVSDLRRFRADYPGWAITKDIHATLVDIHDEGVQRWSKPS